jgi:hypothetical protein
MVGLAAGFPKSHMIIIKLALRALPFIKGKIRSINHLNWLGRSGTAALPSTFKPELTLSPGCFQIIKTP